MLNNIDIKFFLFLLELRKDIHYLGNRVYKAPELTEDLLDAAVDRILRPDSRKNPSVFIR